MRRDAVAVRPIAVACSLNRVQSRGANGRSWAKGCGVQSKAVASNGEPNVGRPGRSVAGGLEWSYSCILPDGFSASVVVCIRDRPIFRFRASVERLLVRFLASFPTP